MINLIIHLKFDDNNSEIPAKNLKKNKQKKPHQPPVFTNNSIKHLLFVSSPPLNFSHPFNLILSPSNS